MAQDFRRAIARAQGTTAAGILTAGNYDAVIGIRCTNILTTTIRVDIYVVRMFVQRMPITASQLPPVSIAAAVVPCALATTFRKSCAIYPPIYYNS